MAQMAGGQSSSACFCVGPQGGAPVCPCRMRSVRVENGRYVETIDHGPVERKTRLVPGAFWDTDNPIEVVIK